MSTGASYIYTELLYSTFKGCSVSYKSAGLDLESSSLNKTLTIKHSAFEDMAAL